MLCLNPYCYIIVYREGADSQVLVIFEVTYYFDSSVSGVFWQTEQIKFIMDFFTYTQSQVTFNVIVFIVVALSNLMFISLFTSLCDNMGADIVS